MTSFCELWTNESFRCATFKVVHVKCESLNKRSPWRNCSLLKKWELLKNCSSWCPAPASPPAQRVGTRFRQIRVGKPERVGHFRKTSEIDFFYVSIREMSVIISSLTDRVLLFSPITAGKCFTGEGLTSPHVSRGITEKWNGGITGLKSTTVALTTCS